MCLSKNICILAFLNFVERDGKGIASLEIYVKRFRVKAEVLFYLFKKCVNLWEFKNEIAGLEGWKWLSLSFSYCSRVKSVTSASRTQKKNRCFYGLVKTRESRTNILERQLQDFLISFDERFMNSLNQIKLWITRPFEMVEMIIFYDDGRNCICGYLKRKEEIGCYCLVVTIILDFIWQLGFPEIPYRFCLSLALSWIFQSETNFRIKSEERLGKL